MNLRLDMEGNKELAIQRCPPSPTTGEEAQAELVGSDTKSPKTGVKLWWVSAEGLMKLVVMSETAGEVVELNAVLGWEEGLLLESGNLRNSFSFVISSCNLMASDIPHQ